MSTTVFIPTPASSVHRPAGHRPGRRRERRRGAAEPRRPSTRELQHHLYTADGKLRSFVNVYVNDEDIRYLSKEQTPVGEKDTVSIVPSVAGGSARRSRRRALPELTSDEVRRYSRHLIMPEVGVEGQRKLKAAQRALRRRGRPRIAGGALPGGGRRRHARPGRLRHRRLQQPAAPGALQHRGRRPAEAAGGQRSAARPQPERHGRRRTRRR